MWFDKFTQKGLDKTCASMYIRSMENKGGNQMIKLNRSVVLDIVKRGKTADDILNIIDALIKAEYVTVNA